MRHMLYATWIVASVLFFPIGLVGLVAAAATGWLLPLPLLNLSALMMLASVPGVAYVVVIRDL